MRTARTPASAALVRWWWVRHGSVAGPAGRILGQLDPPAACAGEGRRLAALARILPRHAYWVTSALRRTRDTSAAIAAAGNHVLNPCIESGLNEQHFGAWQGLNHDAVARRHAADCRRVWAAPDREAPPGGESFAMLVRRVAAAIEKIVAAAEAEEVVAIAHAGTIRAALALALDLKLERALAFAVDPLSVTRIDRFVVDAGEIGWRIVAVNLDPAGPGG
ncbi:MAG: histidine phosphatase family protein [Rhodospirillales bacterium]|nr:histidine phosphatase family protein [Rhodospirillales bacterium]